MLGKPLARFGFGREKLDLYGGRLHHAYGPIHVFKNRFGLEGRSIGEDGLKRFLGFRDDVFSRFGSDKASIARVPEQVQRDGRRERCLDDFVEGNEMSKPNLAIVMNVHDVGKLYIDPVRPDGVSHDATVTRN